jgi:hypothetical protein
LEELVKCLGWKDLASVALSPRLIPVAWQDPVLPQSMYIFKQVPSPPLGGGGDGCDGGAIAP